MVAVLEINHKKKPLNTIRQWWRVDGKLELIIGLIFFPIFFVFCNTLLGQALAILFLICYTTLKMIVFKRERKLLFLITAILLYLGWGKFTEYKAELRHSISKTNVIDKKN